MMVKDMSHTYVHVAQHLLNPLGRITDMITLSDTSQVQALRDDISDMVDEAKAKIAHRVQNETTKLRQSSTQQLQRYQVLQQFVYTPSQNGC